MTPTPPSIWRAAVAGYRDAARALSAMPLLALVAFAVGLGQALTEFILLPADETRDIFQQVIGYVLTLVWSFLLTPLLIAVHRFILLDEVTSGYPIEPGNPRFLRFFAWSFGLTAAVAVFDFLTTKVNDLIPILIVLALFFVGVVFALRLVILFPAIAVDSPGATWRSALRDSKGYAWRIFWILLLASLPALAVVLIAIAGVGYTIGLDLAAARASAPFKIFSVVAYAAATAFLPAVYVAVASRLYQWMGDRVRQA